MLGVAFKEWAAVCDALAAGRQSILLRKGGIHEVGGLFTPEHDRFWLWPTHFHESQQHGLKEGIIVPANTSPGVVTLSHFAVVERVAWIDKLDEALALDALHVWNEATIRQRFAYRTPGLWRFDVQVWPVPAPHTVVETPEQAGCKSWVVLKEELATEGAFAGVPPSGGLPTTTNLQDRGSSGKTA